MVAKFAPPCFLQRRKRDSIFMFIDTIIINKTVMRWGDLISQTGPERASMCLTKLCDWPAHFSCRTGNWRPGQLKVHGKANAVAEQTQPKPKITTASLPSLDGNRKPELGQGGGCFRLHYASYPYCNSA
jgi:hypothetical protein